MIGFLLRINYGKTVVLLQRRMVKNLSPATNAQKCQNPYNRNLCFGERFLKFINSGVSAFQAVYFWMIFFRLS